MAQEIRDPQTLETTAVGDPSLSRNSSFNRLNARAPEFVPRSGPNQAAKIQHHHQQQQHQPVAVHMVYHHPPPPPPPVMMYQHQHHHHHHDYYGCGGDVEEQHNANLDLERDPVKDGLSEEVTQKITKQVEYYFSDANLATTEHLMRFITKDSDGFVPISVVASFKKIKALVSNNSLLADALRTSSKLVVSEDGKKVRRKQSFTESDVEELQSRIIVAENLPDNHCYQSLMKVFSVVGSVKTIRTCYPQAPNGTSSATNRSSKLDMLFANKLHAFVEYETVEDAEKAVAELNDSKNWRSGLRVRLLSSCMVPLRQGPCRGKKQGHEGDELVEEEDASTSDQSKVKQVENDSSQSVETLHEQIGEEVLNDKDSGQAKLGKGWGRGGKGRGRGHYHHHSNSSNHHHHHRGGGHTIGTPPASHPIHNEQAAVSKQPPGPRMPDGTKGFAMGRGKLLSPPSV